MDSTEPLTSTASLRHAFSRNFLHGSHRGIAFTLNSIILVPVLLSQLGKERFGLVAIVTPFLRFGLYGVFDFGLSAACVRYLSRDHAEGNVTGVNRIVINAFVVYGLACSLLLILQEFAAPFVLRHLFRAGTTVDAGTVTFLSGALWIYCVFLMSNPFFSLLMGIQKVHLSHAIGTVSLMVELGGVLLLVPGGITLSKLLVVYGVNAAVGFALSTWLAFRYFRPLKLEPRLASFASITALLNYCAKYSATTTVSILNPILDKLILGRFVGLSSVALYEAAARITEILKRATRMLLLPLFPLAGATERDGAAVQQRLYSQVFRANLFLSAGLYLIPAAFCFQICRVWLGAGAASAALALRWLAVTGFFLAVIGPAVAILAGQGKFRLLLLSGLGGLAVNVTVSPLLAYRFGFNGLLVGTAIAYGGIPLVMLIYTTLMPEFKLPAGWLCRSSAAVVCGACIPSVAILSVLSPISLQALAVCMVIALGGYVGLMLMIPGNRNAAREMLKRIKEPGRASALL